MKVALIKPYSIWTEPLTKECRDQKIIAIFTDLDGMWKEFSGVIFGISRERMDMLIKNDYAKPIETQSK